MSKDDRDEDCPLCLEPLPPYWDREHLITLTCCDKRVCKGCADLRDDFLDKAKAEGTYGRQEAQLAGCCPMCRFEFPRNDVSAKAMERKYIDGSLPLRRYDALGECYMHGLRGLDENSEKGIEILMLGAEKGDPCCQHAMANIYFTGKVVPKSLEQAKRWYLAAAEQGHAVAEYYLGHMSAKEGNDAEYLRYLRGSASKGFDDARHALGLAYFQGSHGLQQSSEEEAIRVLTPAAERGHERSMSLLGCAMCRGPHPAKNNPSWVKGMHWLRRAAEKGDHQESTMGFRMMEEINSSSCFGCTKQEPLPKSFLRCSRCRAAWYCSKDCQRRHWKAEDGHKQFCIKWTEEVES